MSSQRQSKHVIAARIKRKAMLDFIQKAGVATYPELHALTKLTDQGINKHMHELRAEKLIEIVKNPRRDSNGGQRPSVFVRPGFKPDFGPAPVRAVDEQRASDFHGVRIVMAGGEKLIDTSADCEPPRKKVRSTSEATNAKVFDALPGTVQQIMAVTKLSKASVGSACVFLVFDERAHVGRYDQTVRNGHWTPVYFAGPGVSVPNPDPPMRKAKAAPSIDAAPVVRRDPLVAALFGPAGAA